MKIQINTDKTINGSEKLNDTLTSLLTDELNRFSEQITRLEVHLTDEDGNKDGKNDKRCMLEARMEGIPPIAVINHAETCENAVKGAAEKLKSSINSNIGRLKSH